MNNKDYYGRPDWWNCAQDAYLEIKNKEYLLNNYSNGFIINGFLNNKKQTTMKYFSIKCKTWNEACELFYEAAKLGWLYSHDNGLFGINSFDIYKGLMVFNVGTKRFVFEEKGVSYHFEYEKAKAINLLNGNLYVEDYRKTDTGYEFYLSNGKQIKYGEKILASDERQIENPSLEQLVAISYYREHIKPELDKKAGEEWRNQKKEEPIRVVRETIDIVTGEAEYLFSDGYISKHYILSQQEIIPKHCGLQPDQKYIDAIMKLGSRYLPYYNKLKHLKISEVKKKESDLGKYYIHYFFKFNNGKEIDCKYNEKLNNWFWNQPKGLTYDEQESMNKLASDHILNDKAGFSDIEFKPEYYKYTGNQKDIFNSDNCKVFQYSKHKPLKITAAKKEHEGLKNKSHPFFSVTDFIYTISFNDGHTINCEYSSLTKRKKVIQSKKFTITDKHLELIYDYIDKDNQISPFKVTGNEPYFSGSKQFYGEPDWLTELANAFKETQKEIDEKLKKQQPESHKIRMNQGGSQCFRNEANPIIDSKERILITHPENIKVGIDMTKEQIEILNEIEKYKSKYEKQKEKKKEYKIRLARAEKGYGEICVIWNTADKLISQQHKRITEYEEIIKEIKRIHPESKCGILEYLKSKCTVTELGIEKITDSERIELKSLYELLNEKIPGFSTKESFRDRYDCIEDFIIDAQKMKTAHDEILTEFAINIHKKENEQPKNVLINETAVLDKNNKTKLVVRTGLTYKGRRVSDNRWLNGTLVKIKSVGEKGIVIMENKKGRHEVIYRTLEQIK